ncbi:peptide chain release factor 1 [Methanobrevibacter woesei]|mgnify:FL=1|uniref:Peptide chain release factor subunit 1 n=1 Tax=Methanobrevibacter woesei TaxID=190976 RepID=A0A2U1S7H0_9EURY|nr:peptide chain release factor aRF-1 [Methanobrevibacter woesei]MCC9262262.1 peptide chain release factor aRF-1 [Methanobrevibacter woesei]PWB85928.1 peptide chain release factor 1 [Methanobrevibacter woesei]
MAKATSKELYEFKKTLKELSGKRGKGTELVSVYIPHDKQLSDVGKQMRDELGQSANIKSKSTRKNVQSAIEVILQRIRLFKQPPENGLVLFVGMIPKGGPGTEKMETYVFEPPEAITTYWYQCNNEFFLEPLEHMIEEHETYGLAVIDRKEATIATLKGKKVTILNHLTSGVPGKHKAGGQSQRRFDRVIDLAAHEFKKRIGDHMNEDFLALEELKGVIIGGPGFTKEEFVKGDYLNYEIKDKIIATVDTSYTGEFGIREVIDKSADILNDLDVMHEKKIVQKFLKELIKEKGLAAYGENEVRNSLIMGAVDTLLLSEDLVAIHKVLKCPACGETKELTVKNEAEYSKADYRCEKCNESLKEESSLDLIDDFVEKAEEMDTTVEFISSETEEGMQLLRAFGGIAAILRYHLG